MAFPETTRLELLILQELKATGGSDQVQYLYNRLIGYFPQLTPDELAARTEHGRSRWRLLVQRAGKQLEAGGEIKRERTRWTLALRGWKRVEAEAMLLDRVNALVREPSRSVSHKEAQAMLGEAMMRSLYAIRFVLLFALLWVVLPETAVAQGALPADLDAYAKRALAEFEVPGLAVAVVKDGKLVLAKGYGVRKLGESAAVDERTLFGIASNTKAFTAAALAMLVDEGKLRWDDPVIRHLPWFQMYDPYVTRELTVRDLLTHRSGMGLGAGDLLFLAEHDVFA